MGYLSFSAKINRQITISYKTATVVTLALILRRRRIVNIV